MLLAGEWGHMSDHPSVPGHSFQPLNFALDPSGLLILMGRGDPFLEEETEVQSGEEPRVQSLNLAGTGQWARSGGSKAKLDPHLAEPWQEAVASPSLLSVPQFPHLATST